MNNLTEDDWRRISYAMRDYCEKAGESHHGEKTLRQIRQTSARVEEIRDGAAFHELPGDPCLEQVSPMQRVGRCLNPLCESCTSKDAVPVDLLMEEARYWKESR